MWTKTDLSDISFDDPWDMYEDSSTYIYMIAKDSSQDTHYGHGADTLIFDKVTPSLIFLQIPLAPPQMPALD